MMFTAVFLGVISSSLLSVNALVFPRDNSSSISTTSSTSTSIASASPAVATPAGASYLACYSDSLSSRTLPSFYSRSSSMTVESCLSLAQSNGYQYFGVEYSMECWASNSIASSATIIDSSSCNMACTGASSELCGGSDALNIYTNLGYSPATDPKSVGVTPNAETYTPVSYGYIGCYTDSVSARTLGASDNPAARFADSTMSIEECTQNCYNAGYPWAGVEYGQECYCNFDGPINDGVLVPDSQCDMRCAGNDDEFCGAGNRISIYKRTIYG